MRCSGYRVISFLLVLLYANAIVAQFYKATRLQLLPGAVADGRTSPLGINNSAIAPGTCALPNGDRHVCYWSSDGTVHDLGTLGGADGIGRAVNNSGEIVGDSTSVGNSVLRAFLWTQASGMQPLPSLGQGVQDSALAINDSGSVVGFSCLGSECTGDYHAVLWTQAAAIQDLGTLPGGQMTFATGINSADHVVGFVDLPNATHAFLWTPSTGMQELAPEAGLSNYAAFAISSSDQVVGQYISPVDSQFHAFLWTRTSGIQDLGVLNKGWSSASAINNAGDVVGVANTENRTSTAYSVGWLDGGTIQNLSLLVTPNNPRLLLGAATGINLAGQVVVAGKKYAYLLTPITHITLSSSANPSKVGQAVTFTATVTSISGAPPDGEQITFTAGSSILGIAALHNGVASFSTSTLKAGSHKIKATYPGDVNFQGSKSTSLIQVVNN